MITSWLDSLVLFCIRMEYLAKLEVVVITVLGESSSSLEENIRSMVMEMESNKWKSWFIIRE